MSLLTINVFTLSAMPAFLLGFGCRNCVAFINDYSYSIGLWFVLLE